MYFEAKHGILRGFVGLCSKASNLGQARLAFRMNWSQFVSIFTRLKYFRMVHSEPMVLFVGLAESFCLCIFCLLLLLGIVVDMLLAAPSSYLK